MRNAIRETGIQAARELTEAELARVQGGNIFGDAWNAVKGVANDAVDAVQHPVETLARIASWIGRIKLPPYKPGPYL